MPMHEGERAIDAALVRALLTAQFPAWADLPLERLPIGGTDNAIFRLGGDMTVRLPLIASAAGQAEKEARWLPRLAPHLPLAIPTPLALGQATTLYPLSWAVYRWLPGNDALRVPPRDRKRAARDLAGFIVALQAIDTTQAPDDPRLRAGRGGPLAPRDVPVRAALRRSEGLLDVGAATALWERVLAAPAWQGSPRWLHADLHPANLLTMNGMLSAVIDWGSLAIGDPATELIAAWAVLDDDGREILRGTLDVEDAAWVRGKGWALSMAVIALPYYIDTNPVLAAVARRILGELLGSRAVAGPDVRTGA
jgi:aminoglycoside phosphotransferase (APT) family kinase protein